MKRRKRFRLQPILIVVLSIAIVAIVAVKFIAPLWATDKQMASGIEPETMETPVATEEAPATEASSDELVAEAEATTEVTAEPATEVTEVSTRETFAYDEATAKPGYINTTEITQEVFDTFVENLNSNWDFSQRSKEEFIAEHPEIFGDYPKDMDGKLAIPFEGEDQMIAQDEARQNAAKLLGLETQPINDALDFPNPELTEADVKAILKARTNQKVKLEKDLEDYEVAIFKDWLSKPVVFEAFINLMLDQKIGSDFTLRENWTGPTKFVEKYDQAREEGTGVNYWLRDFEDEAGNHYPFMTTEYVYDYVIPFISFVYTQPFSCEVLASREHYHLVAGDNDALRKAELAKYRENKAAFVWRFMLKDNTVALMLGDNVRDGRPEILNYTVIKKPPVKKVDPTPPPVKQQDQVVTNTSTTTTSTPPSSDNPPGDNNPPHEDPPKEETKSPSNDNANAETDHKDDDPGPGTWKPDQGNSKSDTVEGSQAHADTVVNTDGAKSENYPQGSAADHTDNGATPDTSAKENQIGTGDGVNNATVVDDSTGKQSETNQEKTVSGKISAPPAD